MRQKPKISRMMRTAVSTRLIDEDGADEDDSETEDDADEDEGSDEADDED